MRPSQVQRRSGFSTNIKNQADDPDARFSADFIGGRHSLDHPNFSTEFSQASLPGSIPSPTNQDELLYATNIDKDYRHDSEASFTNGADADVAEKEIDFEAEKERLRAQAKEAVEAARRRAGEEAKEAAAADFAALEGLCDFYEQQLRQAAAAREAWREQRKEYDDVLEELTMSLSEAKEKAEAVKEVVDQQREKKRQSVDTGFRGVVLLGQKKTDTAPAVFEALLGQTDTAQVGVSVDEEDDWLMSKTEGKGILGEGLARFLRKFRVFFNRLYRGLKKIAGFFNFFSHDVTRVAALYGGPVTTFFVFTQATVALGMITLFCYLPLLISQVWVVATGNYLYLLQCGWLDHECWLLFGGFDSHKALFYLITSLGAALGTLIFSIRQWAAFDRTYQEIKLRSELEGRRRFCKVALVAWDFRKSGFSGEAVSRSLEALKIEDETNESFANMTKSQRRQLFLRRVTGFVLNIIVIAIGWASIAVTSIYQETVQNWLTGGKNVSGIAKFVSVLLPSLVFQFVNFLAPNALQWITDWEKWPPGVADVRNIWRVFLSSILNVFVYVGLYYALIAQVSFANIDQISKSLQFTCNEDQAAMSLLILTFSDAVVGSAANIAFMWLRPWFVLISLKVGITLPREKEFETAGNIVGHLVSLVVMWMAIVIAPFAAVWFPIAMVIKYLSFRYVLYLSSSYNSGATEAMAVGVMVMRLFSVTAIIYGVWAFLILCVKMPRGANCGPFMSGTRAIDTIYPGILDSFNTLAIVLAFAILILLLVVVFRNNKVTTFKKTLEDMTGRFRRLIGQLQRELKRAQQQANVMKGRLERQRKRSSMASN